MRDSSATTTKISDFTRIAIESPPVLASAVRINSRRITATLFAFMFILIGFSLVADYLLLHYPANNHYADNYVAFFYLNNENNLPTLFSVVLLFIAALLNFAIGLVSVHNGSVKSTKWYWYVLGVMFVFLGLDEGLQIHDMISRIGGLQKLSKENSFLYYGWVIPYAAGVLVAGFFFLRFLFSLPANIRNRFIIAGIIYVGGALGLEFVESWAHMHYGKNSLFERALWTIEETMEMTGSILFIHALLDYMGFIKASFTVGESRTVNSALTVSVAE